MKELEHKEAVTLMRWVRLQVQLDPLRWAPLIWLFHIPNGGARNKVVAGKLKAEGVLAGASDYFLPFPVTLCDGREYAGLFLELKAGNNKPTAEQFHFLKNMRWAGYAATWCQGWTAAAAAIIVYCAAVTDLPLDWREFKAEKWMNLPPFPG